MGQGHILPIDGVRAQSAIREALWNACWQVNAHIAMGIMAGATSIASRRVARRHFPFNGGAEAPARLTVVCAASDRGPLRGRRQRRGIRAAALVVGDADDWRHRLVVVAQRGTDCARGGRMGCPDGPALNA